MKACAGCLVWLTYLASVTFLQLGFVLWMIILLVLYEMILVIDLLFSSCFNLWIQMKFEIIHRFTFSDFYVSYYCYTLYWLAGSSHLFVSPIYKVFKRSSKSGNIIYPTDGQGTLSKFYY